MLQKIVDGVIVLGITEIKEMQNETSPFPAHYAMGKEAFWLHNPHVLV